MIEPRIPFKQPLPEQSENQSSHEHGKIDWLTNKWL